MSASTKNALQFYDPVLPLADTDLVVGAQPDGLGGGRDVKIKLSDLFAGKTLNWRGAYNALSAYTPQDVVSYNGSSYVNVLASQGQLPGTSQQYWNVLASKGDQGALDPVTAQALTTITPNATAAANSALAAQNAATTTANLLFQFREYYVGAFASDPTHDGNGNALLAGAEYFNTVSLKMRVYTGSQWNDFDYTVQAATAAAAASAAAASAYATQAQSSAQAASGAQASANAAASSAQGASTSATAASGSATAAANSATAAAGSASTLNAAIQSFNAAWLGEHASDPTVDGNGNPLVAGAEYYNTTEKKIRVYNGSAWGDYDATAQTASSNAVLSATQSANSASAAAGSATAAAASATSASTSATTANTAQTNASASATAAAGSATAAAASAASANILMNGITTLNLASAALTLTAAQYANAMLIFTGVLTANTVVTIPNTAHTFIAANNTTGPFSLVIQSSGTGTVQVPQGKAGSLFSDGSNVYAAASSTSGLQFAGHKTLNANTTLDLTYAGSVVFAETAGIQITLPVATTYQAGAGIAFVNYTTGTVTVVVQGSDMTDQGGTVTLHPNDYMFIESNAKTAATSTNNVNWRLVDYSNWNKPTFPGGITANGTGVTFPDGTTQSTANGVTAPTSVVFSLANTNLVVGGTSIVTSGYTAPFVEVYRNGGLLTQGVDYTLGGDNKTLNFTNAFTKVDAYEVRTKVVYSPSTVVAPTSVYFTPVAGTTSLPVAYTSGFARLYQNGFRLVSGIDFDQSTGTVINFLNFTSSANDTFEVEIWTPMSVSNMVPLSGGILTGQLTAAAAGIAFSDGSVQQSAGFSPWRNKLDNGAMFVDQSGSVTGTTATATYWGGADRWNMTNGNCGCAASQIGYAGAANFTYNGIVKSCLQQQIITPPSSFSGSNYWGGISQTIEGLRCVDVLGKPTVASFLFNTNVTGVYTFSLRTAAGTSYSFLYNFNAVANTPQRVVIPIPALPSGATINRDNTRAMYFSIGALNNGTFQGTTAQGAAGAGWQTGTLLCTAASTAWTTTAGNIIQATEIQWEIGTQATPFEFRPYSVEFAQAQRFYATVIHTRFGYSSAAGAEDRIFIPWPVTMSSTPAVSYKSAPALNNATTLTSIAYDTRGVGARLNNTAAGQFGVDTGVIQGDCRF